MCCHVLCVIVCEWCVVVECDDLKIVWLPIRVLSVLVLYSCDADGQVGGVAMGVWKRTDAPVRSHQYSCGSPVLLDVGSLGACRVVWHEWLLPESPDGRQYRRSPYPYNHYVIHQLVPSVVLWGSGREWDDQCGPPDVYACKHVQCDRQRMS